ncbi:hypothetical protein THASP1DRAFT_32724 [Thamnocephalis sphaerospora]|uniref:DUF4209 domain-containing protein n=1 Tax=Thamnocephalis sphaerospora TaxID=78915 RepID=A0A4P9XIC1_9FUNG|nr:hypothetical protein THASP1DRAFT_32724 [Thamnocephalis sphaerospora]|eukprot:RKP05432.1 hypothetical protein THASP1DRAFT_32724 [Thamnocephalis sphaerospora]
MFKRTAHWTPAELRALAATVLADGTDAYDIDDADVFAQAATRLRSMLIEKARSADNTLAVDWLDAAAAKTRAQMGPHAATGKRCGGQDTITKPHGWFPALLAATSTMERLLGDIVFTSTGQAGSVPFLLRDLLIAPPLIAAIGADRVFLLRLLIGPPTGMNLRNVAWHGFLSPSFGASGRQYAALLLALVLDTAQRVCADGTCLKYRAQIAVDAQFNDLNVMLSAREQHGDGDDAREIFLWPTASDGCMQQWTERMEQSLPDAALWWREIAKAAQLAFDEWKVDGVSSSGHFGYATITLLPLLEHALRQLWVCVNELDSQRCCAADSRQQYCIMDDILCREVTLSGQAVAGQDNILAQRIHESGMDLLMDLFAYTHGPRVRDRMAHGEIAWAGSIMEGGPAMLGTLMTATLLVAHALAQDTGEIARQIMQRVSSLNDPLAKPSTRRRRQRAVLLAAAPNTVRYLRDIQDMLVAWIVHVASMPHSSTLSTSHDNVPPSAINSEASIRVPLHEKKLRKLATLVGRCCAHAIDGHWERVNAGLAEAVRLVQH